MASKNKVIWSDGLFIKPQHFQQQHRYIDYVINEKFDAQNCYHYGFSHLEFNQELLKLGKIGIVAASGTMPDGTLFSIPYQDLAPTPIEITNTNDIAGNNIYLTLPLQNDVINEINTSSTNRIKLARYNSHLMQVSDLHTENGDISVVSVAQLAPKLMQGTDDLSAQTALPICRIKERHVDGTLILDDTFIPCINAISASAYLQKFLDEVAGLVLERAKQLAARIGSPSQQGIADVAEFLMLQVLNRAQPAFMHLSKRKSLHPEAFYYELSKLCAELMTFTDESRLAPQIAAYQHENLTESFNRLIIYTRQALSTVLMPKAVSITLHEQKEGLYVAVINDPQLLDTASFVLAVKASMTQENLRHSFVKQVKITSPDKIKDLVTIQIAGVPITALSAAPKQLPYHAGYTYFAIDTRSPDWAEIKKTKSIVFHISGIFPDLDMQLWAVRG